MKRGAGGAPQSGAGSGSRHATSDGGGGRSPTGDPYGAFLGAIDAKYKFDSFHSSFVDDLFLVDEVLTNRYTLN